MQVTRKVWFITGFFFCVCTVVYCQNQKLADSLKKVYLPANNQHENLEILKLICQNETNQDLRIEFINELINKAATDSLFGFLHSGYLQKGNALRNKGDNVKALQSYFESLKFANRIKDQKGVGSLMISIADTYSIMDDSKNAETYYSRGISILRDVKDDIQLATALLNAGDEYLKTKQYDFALQHFQESGAIFKKADYLIGTAYNLGNLGMVYAEQGKDVLAEQNISEAIQILESLEDFYPIAVYLTYMADIYIKKNDYNTANSYAKRSLDLATDYGLKDQISEANLKLAELYELMGNKEDSYKYYKNHIIYRDSVKNINAVQAMANMRTDYEVSQKQIEVDLLNQKRKTQRIIVYATIGALFLIGLLAMGLFKRNKYIQATNRIIENERNRSDKLLLNILPEETAQELKDHGKVKAQRFESVTVLFSDFKGFTHYAEHLPPEELVESIDYYFSKFDDIMEKYNLEKIKTVGDAYMCAGGLKHQTIDHANTMVKAALEMIAFVNDSKSEGSTQKVHFDIRVGINTGPVVAGVVGSKKFAYDIWGDTVNVASRMETNSEVGKINISESTKALLDDSFICTYRGNIEVKNRGTMRMYFVDAES